MNRTGKARFEKLFSTNNQVTNSTSPKENRKSQGMKLSNGLQQLGSINGYMGLRLDMCLRKRENSKGKARSSFIILFTLKYINFHYSCMFS